MKENYQAFLLGNSFRIHPPQAALPSDSRINLSMDRGAFGSGEHETTESCIEILENHPFNGKEKILDLGSGTGILSIAALLLGGGQAWCVDIEQEAVNSCRINGQLNAVADKINHFCGTLEQFPEKNFDLILANIYGDILLDVAENLVAKAQPGARLLLSGILWEYNFDVRQRYQRLGCRLIKNRMLEEFSTVLMEKE
ncbi:MAG TPA: 50S ribosomal protein L11 methyltransferase [Malonomonas sp.]